jgi:hypothetical protein
VLIEAWLRWLDSRRRRCRWTAQPRAEHSHTASNNSSAGTKSIATSGWLPKQEARLLLLLVLLVVVVVLTGIRVVVLGLCFGLGLWRLRLRSGPIMRPATANAGGAPPQPVGALAGRLQLPRMGGRGDVLAGRIPHRRHGRGGRAWPATTTTAPTPAPTSSAQRPAHEDILVFEPRAEPTSEGMLLAAGEAAGTAPPRLAHRRRGMVALLQVQHLLFLDAAVVSAAGQEGRRRSRRSGGRRVGRRGIPAGRLVEARPFAAAFALLSRRAWRKDAAEVRKADVELLGGGSRGRAADTSSSSVHRRHHRLDGSFGALPLGGGQGHRHNLAAAAAAGSSGSSATDVGARCTGGIRGRGHGHGPSMGRGRRSHMLARSLAR